MMTISAFLDGIGETAILYQRILGARDAETGWPNISWNPISIKCMCKKLSVIPRDAPAGTMVEVRARLFTMTFIQQDDEILYDSLRWRVEDVQFKHILLTETGYFDCTLILVDYAISHHYNIPHVNVAHVDTPHCNDAHVDTAHNNTAFHDDPHIDVTHQDDPHSDSSHTDSPFRDSAHINTAFTDTPHGDASHINVTAHQNFPHDNHAHINIPHINISYIDVSHIDSPHSDTPHSDTSYSDSSHWDDAGPPHVNAPHLDTPHGDDPHANGEHVNRAFIDIPHDNHAHDNHAHVNISHINSAHGNTPYVDTDYIDVSHLNDPHSDQAHVDVSHINTSHANTAHENTSHYNIIHGDAPHSNVAHCNNSHDNTIHTDVPHQDSHADTTHVNIPHTNLPPHSNVPHSNVPHSNFPIKSLFMGVTDPDADIGNYHPAVALDIGVTSTVYHQIVFPTDYVGTITALVTVVVPGGTGNMRYGVDTQWAAACNNEVYNINVDAIAATDIAVTVWELECIDISAAFTGIVAGDVVGVTFTRLGGHANDTVGADCYYLGILFKYP